MKRLILTLAVSTMTTVHAEDSAPAKHEFHVSAGTYNSYYIAKGTGFNLDNYLDDKWSGGSKPAGKYSFRNSPTLRAGYSFHLKDQWRLTLDSVTQNFKDNTDRGEIRAWMLGARYSHGSSSKASLYSGFAIGRADFRFDTARADATHTAYQIDALGMRFGKGNLGAEFVLGYGMAGILQGGITARF